MDERNARYDTPNASDTWVCGCSDGWDEGCTCNECVVQTLKKYKKELKKYVDICEDLLRKDRPLGAIDESRMAARLSCLREEVIWYYMARQDSAFDPIFMVLMYIATAVILHLNFCIGVFTLGAMSSSGQSDFETTHIIIWAMAIMFTIMLTGFNLSDLSPIDADGSLAAAVCSVGGFLFSGVLCIMCSCIIKVLKVAVEKCEPFERPFVIGLFDPWFCEPYYLMKDGVQVLCQAVVPVVCQHFHCPTHHLQGSEKGEGRHWQCLRHCATPFLLCTTACVSFATKTNGKIPGFLRVGCGH